MCLGNRLEDFPEKAYSSRQLPFKFKDILYSGWVLKFAHKFTSVSKKVNNLC